MAEEIQERSADLANIPDPALNRKHRIKVDVVFVTNELNIEVGRRLWLKFRKVRRTYLYGRQTEKPKELFDTKAGLYVSQSGKWGIVWLDDKWWRIMRKKRLAKRTSSYSTPVTLKVDVAPIEMEESRAKSLDKLIAKAEFEVEEEDS
jgi:hypothetical protein